MDYTNLDHLAARITKSEALAKRLAETEAMFAEAQAANNAQTTAAFTGTGNKLVDVLTKKDQVSVLADSDLFQSQAEYTKALLSMPEPTHDANGEPYALPDRMLQALQNAALAKAENPQADPDADLKQQIHRDTLRADPPLVLNQAPQSPQEWESRAQALRDRAALIGMYVLVVPGEPLPVALGAGGAIIERNSLRLSSDPFGNNNLGQGTVQGIEAALTHIERDKAREQKALADMADYKAKQAAEFQEAQRLNHLRENAPALIEDLQKQIQDLRDELARSKS